jgi:hypothetical protein
MEPALALTVAVGSPGGGGGGGGATGVTVTTTDERLLPAALVAFSV